MIVTPWKNNENLLEAQLCMKEGLSPIMLLRVIPEGNGKYGCAVRDPVNMKLLASSPIGYGVYATAKIAKKDVIKKAKTFLELEILEIKQAKK